MSTTTSYKLGTAVTTTLFSPGDSVLATLIPVGTVFGPSSWAASPNNEYYLIMQGDGNLVLYQLVGPNSAPAQGVTLNLKSMWGTNTAGNSDAVFAVQPDGNLVVYGTQVNSLWASNTNGVWPAGLYLQDDGNLVLYGLDANWSTGTN